jgi:hypothetical protein
MAEEVLGMDESTLVSCPVCVTGTALADDVKRHLALADDLARAKMDLAKITKEHKKCRRHQVLGNLTSWWEREVSGFGLICTFVIILVVVAFILVGACASGRLPQDEKCLMERTGIERCGCYREEAARLARRGDCWYDEATDTACDTLKEQAQVCEAQQQSGGKK